MKTPIRGWRGALPLLTLAAFSLSPAFAVDVIYSTSGQFTSCSAGFTCSGTTLTSSDGLTISFAGTPADSVANVEVPDASYAPFGTFTVTGPSCPPTTGCVTDTVAAHFTLTVTQTAPTAGTEVLHDFMAGTIRVGNSQVTLNFTSGTGDGGNATTEGDPVAFLPTPALKFDFGGVDYWVDVQTPIHPQTAGGTAGSSIINGAINSAVPEPAFYGLTGAGFLAMLGLAIRRRRQQQQA